MLTDGWFSQWEARKSLHAHQERNSKRRFCISGPLPTTEKREKTHDGQNELSKTRQRINLMCVPHCKINNHPNYTSVDDSPTSPWQ